ncbi:PKD domain-containing protein, partial [Hymenobacter terricola]
LSRYDIFRKAGALTATTETFTVTVADGALNLALTSRNTGGVDNPKLSALEVYTGSKTTSGGTPPVANAGPGQTLTLPTSSAVLTGTGTPAGSIAAYAWSQVSGPAPATLSGAATATLTASALVAGAYSFALVVTDTSGTASPASTVAVTVNPAVVAGGPAVANFALVNADTGQDIQLLTTGAVLNLATLPTQHLNVRANTSPAAVGSVVFALSGAQGQNQTESVAPYALFGDVNGVYNPWTPPLGSYSLTGTPFSGGGGSGTAGTPLTVAFTVTNQGARPAASAKTSLATTQSALLLAPATAYPNPTSGRFVVALPAGWQGDASYVLLSEAGATLAQGKRPVAESTRELAFDFSAETQATGAYYLHLAGKNLKSTIKLERP